MTLPDEGQIGTRHVLPRGSMQIEIFQSIRDLSLSSLDLKAALPCLMIITFHLLPRSVVFEFIIALFPSILFW